MNAFYEHITLDKNIPVPLYFQLKQAIADAVQRGELAIGEQLPTEMELCDLLHISRPTVNKAVNLLVSEGYLTRKRGHGTFIANPKILGNFFNKLQSFSEEMIRAGHSPSTQVLSCKIVQGAAPANLTLKLRMDEPCFYLERLRSVDGEPIVYIETYLPLRYFEGIETIDFEVCSLYETLNTRYHRPVCYVTRQFEAINAGAPVAKLLQIAKGYAVCRVETIGFSREGTPLEYSIAQYRGDRNKFTLTLYKEP